jgi:hypothetical protein
MGQPFPKMGYIFQVLFLGQINRDVEELFPAAKYFRVLLISHFLLKRCSHVSVVGSRVSDFHNKVVTFLDSSL